MSHGYPSSVALVAALLWAVGCSATDSPPAGGADVAHDGAATADARGAEHDGVPGSGGDAASAGCACDQTGAAARRSLRWARRR